MRYRSQATPERLLSVEPDVQISKREGQVVAVSFQLGALLWQVFPYFGKSAFLLAPAVYLTTDLIIRGAPYVEMEHDSYILIEHLRRLVDAYPEQVGDIFAVMLEEFAPTYKQEHIEHILTVLFEHGGELRQKANTIFEKYLEYGTEFAVQLRANLVD
jgi:hypothetical protein